LSHFVPQQCQHYQSIVVIICVSECYAQTYLDSAAVFCVKLLDQFDVNVSMPNDTRSVTYVASDSLSSSSVDVLCLYPPDGHWYYGRIIQKYKGISQFHKLQCVI